MNRIVRRVRSAKLVGLLAVPRAHQRLFAEEKAPRYVGGRLSGRWSTS